MTQTILHPNPTDDIQSVPQWTDDCWKRYYELNNRCQYSRLYHQKRHSFYSFWDNFFTAMSLISGTAIFSTLQYENHDLNKWFGGAVVIMTAFQLVFGLKDKAHLHAGLSTEYKKLESAQVAKGVLDSQLLDVYEAAILSIEANEPPDLPLLVRICQNELAFANGGKVTDICWFQRWTAHFIPWSSVD